MRQPQQRLGPHSAYMRPAAGIANLRIMAKKPAAAKFPFWAAFLRKPWACFPVDRGNSDIWRRENRHPELEGRMECCWSSRRAPGCEEARRRADAKGGVGHDGHPLRRAKLVPVYHRHEKAPVSPRCPSSSASPMTPVYTGRKGTAEEYQANADEMHAPGLCSWEVIACRVDAGQKRRFLLRRPAGPWSWPEKTAAEDRRLRDAGQHHPQRQRGGASWRQLGVRQVDSSDEVRPGETVIIRSHGESQAGAGAAGGHGRPVRQRHLSQRAAHPAAGGPGRGRRGACP